MAARGNGTPPRRASWRRPVRRLVGVAGCFGEVRLGGRRAQEASYSGRQWRWQPGAPRSFIASGAPVGLWRRKDVVGEFGRFLVGVRLISGIDGASRASYKPYRRYGHRATYCLSREMGRIGGAVALRCFLSMENIRLCDHRDGPQQVKPIWAPNNPYGVAGRGSVERLRFRQIDRLRVKGETRHGMGSRQTFL